MQILGIWELIWYTDKNIIKIIPNFKNQICFDWLSHYISLYIIVYFLLQVNLILAALSTAECEVVSAEERKQQEKI